MNKLKIFKALSSENRLKIIEILDENPMCACKIMEKLNLSQSTISHHIKILKDCDLVNCKKEGKWHHYSINLKALKYVQGYFSKLVEKNNNKKGVCNCDS
ncbi:MAG: ArsR/SmtB family transcription factor [Bacillota bacterium]